MESAKQYRDYADKCVAWAEEAETDEEREILLKMANDWLQAAAVLERRRLLEAHTSSERHAARAATGRPD
jgi:hypothetical protein